MAPTTYTNRALRPTYLLSFDGRTQHPIEGIGKNYYYLRSHCALYRTELLKHHHLHFADGDLVAGKFMHKKLVEAGHDMIFLPSDELNSFTLNILITQRRY